MLSLKHNCRFIANKISEAVNGRQPVLSETLGRQISLLNHPLKKLFSSNVEGSPTLANHNNSPGGNTETETNYDAITNGDKTLETKLKIIMLEAEVLRQEGKAVPESSFVTEEQWKEILNLTTRTARKKYFEYLFKLSKRLENVQVKKEQKRLEFEEIKRRKTEENKGEETIEDHALKYDLQHNNIFLRFYDTTINQMYNNRLIQAIQFGQKLVVDCGYDGNMTKRENQSCAKQLMLIFAENRLHDEPFDVHFCNVHRDSELIKQLHKFIPTMNEPWFPLNLHENSYLNIFPKDQLVYLTPHCREELKEFDHDTVYIIGGIVDKVNNDPLSLAKAKREGLRMAKLPLDRYLQWGSGSGKSLTLNQVGSILLDVKRYGNWEKALRHVPRRKLVDFGAAGGVRKPWDRDGGARQWRPAANVDFGNLSFNNGGRKNDNDARRTVNVNIRSLYEE
ncbi:unnamed protein product [Phaedon cochleariae]|uniref:RNA (guanine-9-)-methyltransferase domain-containing protein 1 n=1 Tax=Phaedon cochleariae TaxID=80249 RepID=A0A9P0DJK3_PHACE|nr:unnamed protein product [Phaedon cochleariae]